MKGLSAILLAGLIGSCVSSPVNDVVARGTSIIPSIAPTPTAMPQPAEGLRVDKKKQAKNVHNFFKAYGWLKKDEAIPETKLPAAIRKIQKVLKVPETGVYDEHMDTVMSKPRCGTTPQYNPSESLENNINKTVHSRYVLWGPKWDHTSITYRFINYTADLPAMQQRSLVRYASSYSSAPPNPLKSCGLVTKSNQCRICSMDPNSPSNHHRSPVKCTPS